MLPWIRVQSSSEGRTKHIFWVHMLCYSKKCIFWPFHSLFTLLRRLQAGFLGYLVIITAYGLYTTVTGAQWLHLLYYIVQLWGQLNFSVSCKYLLGLHITDCNIKLPWDCSNYSELKLCVNVFWILKLACPTSFFNCRIQSFFSRIPNRIKSWIYLGSLFMQA